VAVEPGNPDTAARLEKVSAATAKRRDDPAFDSGPGKAHQPVFAYSETLVKQKVDERTGAQNRAPSEVFAALAGMER
jgi:hydroxyacylglutathione hydrolase